MRSVVVCIGCFVASAFCAAQVAAVDRRANRSHERPVADSAAQTSSAPISDVTQALRSRVRRNMFIIHRGLVGSNTYHELLGPVFSSDQQHWHSKMKILDCGAGTAGLFRDLIRNNFSRRNRLPTMVALGVKRPRSVPNSEWYQEHAKDFEAAQRGVAELSTMLQTHAHCLTYVEGELGVRQRPRLTAASRRLEKRLGRRTFDRVVMAFGADAYTLDITGLYSSLGRLMRPGALLHTFLQGYSTVRWPGSQYRCMSLLPISWEQWFGAMEGFDLAASSKRGSDYQITLRRTADSLQIPELSIDRDALQDGAPPTRSFVWQNAASYLRRYLK